MQNSLDDTDSSIIYSGPWNAASDISGAFGNTLHTALSPASSLSLTIRSGSAMYVYGNKGPTNGDFSVTVDDGDPTIISAYSRNIQPQVLLYQVTRLDPTDSHTLTITNLGRGETSNSLEFQLDGIVWTQESVLPISSTARTSTSSTSSSTIQSSSTSTSSSIQSTSSSSAISSSTIISSSSSSTTARSTSTRFSSSSDTSSSSLISSFTTSNSTSEANIAANENSTTSPSTLSTGAIIGLSLGIFLATAFISAFVVWFIRRKKINSEPKLRSDDLWRASSPFAPDNYGPIPESNSNPEIYQPNTAGTYPYPAPLANHSPMSTHQREIYSSHGSMMPNPAEPDDSYTSMPSHSMSMMPPLEDNSTSMLSYMNSVRHPKTSDDANNIALSPYDALSHPDLTRSTADISDAGLSAVSSNAAYAMVDDSLRTSRILSPAAVPLPLGSAESPADYSNRVSMLKVTNPETSSSGTNTPTYPQRQSAELFRLPESRFSAFTLPALQPVGTDLTSPPGGSPALIPSSMRNETRQSQMTTASTHSAVPATAIPSPEQVPRSSVDLRSKSSNNRSVDRQSEGGISSGFSERDSSFSHEEEQHDTDAGSIFGDKKAPQS